MAVLASDDFAGLGTTALTGRTANNALGGSGSRNWVTPSGGLQFQGDGSGAVVSTSASGSNFLSVSGANKARVRINPNGATNNVAIWGRRDNDPLGSADGVLILFVSQTSLRAASITAGARTDHATAVTTAPGTTFWLEIEVSGLVLTGRVLNNDLSVRNTVTHTFASSVPSGGDHWGFSFYASGFAAIFDDFIVDDGAGGDLIAPTLTLPTLAATSPTTLDAGFTSDEAGFTWTVLTPAAQAAPSEAQIRAGQDATGAAAVASSLNTAMIVGVNTRSLTGATGGTAYKAHTISQDAAGTPNVSNIVSSASETTPVPDLIAPLLSAPVGTVKSNALIVVGATTDEANGTMYLVLTNSATPPSKAQVRTGLNQLGAAAVLAMNQAVSSIGAKTFNATGLTQLTGYYPYIVHTDAAGNDSDVLSIGLRTTFRNGATGQAIVDDTAAIPGVQEQGILFNDVVLPADADKWFSYNVVTPVVDTASLTLFPNGSFIWTGTSADSFTYQLEVDGVNVGTPQLVSLSPENATKRTPNGMIGFWNR